MADRFFPNVLPDFVTLETWGITSQKVSDFTLYCGTLGTAFLLFKSYQLTNNNNDLSLCLAIVDACDSASLSSRYIYHFFLRFFYLNWIISRMQPFYVAEGVCALGAVAAKYAGNQESLNHYLTPFREIKLSRDLPDELLYGRAGFLWACLFLNKHLGEGTIPSTTTRAVVDEIIKKGRALGKKEEEVL
ncbi:hypothetical protein CXB51_035443 [Gossypium anomalum]|uniref:Uncharacterized protein n=1 Tax=Gossypium anomalum TaxID=47600 RepID=A0A8J6CKB6_9ROSI|nr:hypothetical protein CXB51_035443 [Gossypium anomalum]